MCVCVCVRVCVCVCVCVRVCMYNNIYIFHPSTVVLVDLPLPSHYSTLLEQTVTGKTPLTAEAMKVVNSNDVSLSMQIANALTAVDCGFL